jgi:hypothetical protein
MKRSWAVSGSEAGGRAPGAVGRFLTAGVLPLEFPALPSGPGGRVWFAGLMPMAATFRSRLLAREVLYGAWSVIPSALSVQLLAAAGLDYVVSTCSTAGPPKPTCPR